MDPPDSAAALSWVHRNRLRGAGRELRRLAAEMAAIGNEGRSPSAAGPAYTPLPPAEWASLAAPLAELEPALSRLAELAGGEGEPARRGPAAARAALSARLAQMEETLADLHPARLEARYGALPPDLARELAGLCAAMESSLHAARRVLDGSG